MATISRLIALILIAGSQLAPAGAGLIHRGGGSSNGAQLNIGGGDAIPANFINVFKAASLAPSIASDVGLLDDDGYLNGTPSGNTSISFPNAGTMWSGVQYKLNWPSTITFKITFNNTITGCSAVNATVSGCAGASTTITSTGGAGSVTFTTSSTQFSMFLPSGFAYSHSGGTLALYRLTDETAFLAGETFTSEFKSALIGTRARTIRPMGWVQRGAGNFNGETTWNYRVKPTTFTWGGRYPPGAYGGTISGTDTYTGAGSPDTPVSWTDGETYFGVWTNANTTTPTLNIAARGAKTIISNDGLSALSAGAIAGGSIGVVVYDAILDKLLYKAGALNTSIPIEAQASLANSIHANLWATIPPWATDNYVTNWASTVCASLSSNLYLYPEYTNEVWNFSFPQTQWALQRGEAFGWVIGSGQALFGWYGLRVRQIMGNLIPAASGCSRLLRRVMAYQAAGDSTNISNRFNGAQLSTSIGNAAYSTYTGGTNYNSFPNRPIDVADILSYAPYAGGQNLCEGPDLGCAPTAVNAPFYQALVNAWEGSDPTTSIAMVDSDVKTGVTSTQTVTGSGTTFTTPLAHGFTANSTDIAFQVSGGTLYSGLTQSALYRVTSTPTSTTFIIQAYVGGFPSGSNINAGTAGSGTVSVGIAQRSNMLRVGNTYEQFGEANAALYDGARPSGMPNLRVEWYEGNLEPVGPTVAQCTSLSITGTNCSGSIAAAILAWKADPKAATTQLAYFNQFIGSDPSYAPTFGLMPHSKVPSNLILPNACGGGISSSAGPYALLSDCLPNSTPYQLYNGFAAFIGGP